MMKYQISIFLILTSILLITCSNINTIEMTELKQTENKPDFSIEEINIPEIQKGYLEGKFTVTEIVQAYLNRIEAMDKNGVELNAVLEINYDALEIAKRLDEQMKTNKTKGALFGIPVLLKDNIDTKDKMPTTAGSKALAGSMPLQDSWVVAKLREADAVILGKTNLSEWANFRSKVSSSGWSGLGGQTKNPYKLDRNPCGSSSGSGVAVAASLSTIAIGTETNGSIVCPSNNNGVVGLKPTVGLISRRGIIPISFTQDSAGPMGRTVEDVAICLGALTGVDQSDAKSVASENHFLKDYTPHLIKEGLQDKRIGIYKPFADFHPKVNPIFQQAIEDMKAAGAELIEIEKVMPEKVYEESYQVMLYEFKDGLHKYLVSLGDDAPIKNIEELIAFNKNDETESLFDQKILMEAAEKGGLDSEDYQNKLAKMQTNTQKEGMDKVMQENKLDAFIAPTNSPAWKTDLTNGDLYMGGSSSLSAMAGYPIISVPMGMVDGLPVGMSIWGKAWSESTLIEIAYAYEQLTQHRKAPQYLPN